MKKFVVPALAALALAACADSTPDNTDAMATAEGDAAMMAPAPAATETTVVTPVDGTATDTADRVEIGPDGVTADVGDADTRVRADTNAGTLTVED
ncbi:hypothetical protein [Tsuneonella troitsensis]|uniref:hypothetical protein n=1 Tax=Tsuneonella troitsensis TaxID=292222 RepID=UPI00070FB153|nr:hypothetical protein [Tsuneonella troitsensis]